MPGQWRTDAYFYDGMRTLVVRSLDYLLTRDYGALQIALDAGEVGVQEDSAQITATVSAVSGYSVPGIAATLTMPAEGVVLTGLTIDGVEATATDVVSLGDMTDGDVHTVVWTVDLTEGWGSTAGQDRVVAGIPRTHGRQV